MKKIIFLITIIILTLGSACDKTKQQLFHHKNWKNIQGNWDMTSLIINGADSTLAFKSKKCYTNILIDYSGEKRGNYGLFLENVNGKDYCEIFVEDYKYKKMVTYNMNLGIPDIDVKFHFCNSQFYHDTITWDINNLTATNLDLSAIHEGNTLQVKYVKF